MKLIIRGIKAFFMVIGAGCCGLFLLAWSDIHWMLTSPDDAVPPWHMEKLEDEAGPVTDSLESDRVPTQTPTAEDGYGSPSLDEAGPAGVTQ